MIEAIKLALEALKENHYYMIDAGLPNQSMLNKTLTAYKTLEEALAKQEQGEPVGWIDSKGNMICTKINESCKPIYTTPQTKEWVGLMRGVRVEGNSVIITVNGGNDEARFLCEELINEMAIYKEKT